MAPCSAAIVGPSSAPVRNRKAPRSGGGTAVTFRLDCRNNSWARPTPDKIAHTLSVLGRRGKAQNIVLTPPAEEVRTVRHSSKGDCLVRRAEA